MSYSPSKAEGQAVFLESGTTQEASRSGGAVRWIVLGVLSLGIAFNYIDRTALSVALPAMTKEFGLSPQASGLILSAFYWAYVLFMIPGGRLVDRLGPKNVFGIGSVIWGFTTVALAAATGFVGTFVMRLVMGASEAPSYPAASSVVRDWFPKKERSFASGTFNNGSKLGATLAVPMVSTLVGLAGWRGAFVVSGVLAALFGVFWLWWYRSPRSHAQLSAAELRYIESDQESIATSSKIKWTKLLTNRSIAAMSVGFFAVNFVSYFFFTWFPTYLITTFHLSILSFGLLGMLPGIAAIIGGFIGGWASDALYRSGRSVTVARKLPLVVCLLGSSVIGLAAFSPTIGLTLTLLCLANAFATGAGSVLWALPGDIAPARDLVGTIGSIQNAVANLAGIVCPILIGVVLGVTHSFVWPLVIAGIVAVIGALSYAFWLPKIEPLHFLVAEAE
jgi:sugar phosphate permease